MSAQHTEEFILALNSIENSEQRVKVLTVKDKSGASPANDLAEYNHKEFIEVLDSLDVNTKI